MVCTIWSGQIRTKLLEDIKIDIFYYIFHEIDDLASVCWNFSLSKNLIFGLKTGIFGLFWNFLDPILPWKHEKIEISTPKIKELGFGVTFRHFSKCRIFSNFSPDEKFQLIFAQCVGPGGLGYWRRLWLPFLTHDISFFKDIITTEAKIVILWQILSYIHGKTRLSIFCDFLCNTLQHWH